MLPNNAYTDADYLLREARSVFRATWQFAGRASQLSRPGDAVPTTIGRTPVLLVRDTDNRIRAFANVCPHRGARLLGKPCSGLNGIVCPITRGHSG